MAGKLNVILRMPVGSCSHQNVVSSSGITQTATDMVSWSSGASGQIQNVPSSTKDRVQRTIDFNLASATLAVS